jgi:hypothetical protein
MAIQGRGAGGCKHAGMSAHPAVPLMVRLRRALKGVKYRMPSRGCTPDSTLQGQAMQGGHGAFYNII